MRQIFWVAKFVEKNKNNTQCLGEQLKKMLQMAISSAEHRLPIKRKLMQASKIQMFAPFKVRGREK